MIMNRRIRAALTITVGVGTGSCVGPPEPELVCTAQINGTIAVSVLNAGGTARVPATTLVLRSAAFYDSVTTSETSRLVDSDYRWMENQVPGGVYSLVVKKPGYAAQQLTVTVPQDRCHSGPGPLVKVRLQTTGSI